MTLKKKFVFVSDFDGTISGKDFYWHIIEKYMPEKGQDLYKQWKMGNLLDIEFLGTVFQNIGQSENQIYKDILQLPIDPYLKPFIDFIHQQGGDFVVLSAGTSYYIDILFAHHGIEGITIYSNKGIYKSEGIHFELDPTHAFYSERYGIDKKKVVQHLKEKYETLYYAGDSGPDYEASLLCNLRFAKAGLREMYKENHIDFYPFDSFKEIENILIEKGV